MNNSVYLKNEYTLTIHFVKKSYFMKICYINKIYNVKPYKIGIFFRKNTPHTPDTTTKNNGQ